MGWFSAEPSTDETASVDVGSVASASVTSSAEFKKSQLESALRLVKEADEGQSTQSQSDDREGE